MTVAAQEETESDSESFVAFNDHMPLKPAATPTISITPLETVSKENKKINNIAESAPRATPVKIHVTSELKDCDDQREKRGLFAFSGFGIVSNEVKAEQRRLAKERQEREAVETRRRRIREEANAVARKRRQWREKQRAYRAQKLEREIATGMRTPDGKPVRKVSVCERVL